MVATIWMIDPTGKPQGVLPYTRFKAVPRWLDVGTWTVTAPLTPETEMIAEAAGWRVMIQDPTGWYGGPAWMPNAETSKISYDNERKPTITLTGEDDMAWLRDNFAWPKPSDALSSQTVAYDVRTGTASTKILEYVRANIGDTARTERRLPGWVTGADPSVGGTVTGRARFTPLLELIQGMAAPGAIGCRVAADLSTTRTFQVLAPRDLTGDARFSLSIGNLMSITWTLKGPAATTVIGGGRGEETARSFISQTSTEAAQWGGRREGFYDGGTTSTTDSGAELAQNVATQLAESASTRMVEVEPIDTPQMTFGQGGDWWLGDFVTVDIYGGLTMDAQVVGAEISEDRSQKPVRTIKPLIGDLGATKTRAQYVALAKALARIGRLESR